MTFLWLLQLHLNFPPGNNEAFPYLGVAQELNNQGRRLEGLLPAAALQCPPAPCAGKRRPAILWQMPEWSSEEPDETGLTGQ